MAKNSIRDYDATSGNNTDIQSVDISEGCAASGINNAIRELMVDLKNVSTGAVNLETPAADQLNVDNIRIDGNTISSTDTNGDITLDPDGTGAVAITSGFTAADGCTITTADNSAQLTLVSTDADASAGPVLRLNRDSGSPADDDIIGSIVFNADNDASETTEYARLLTIIGDASDSSEDAFIQSDYMIGGTLRNFYKVGGGELVFNEDSQDVNFRVESDNDANAFFVEGSSGNVGIGRSPVAKLDAYLGSGVGGLAVGVSGASTTILDSDLIQFRSGGGSEAARIDSNGSLLVGTTSASMTGFDDARFRSHANGKTGIIVSEVFTDGEGIIIQGSSNTGNRNAIVFLNGGLGTVGSVVFSSSSTSYNTSSDHRLKEAVVDMTGAIDRVKALAPKRFNFIVDDSVTVDGFLAHEAQAVVPEAVTGTHNEVDDDGNAVMQGIDQSKLVPLLTGALQEAIAKIETLETQRADLEARLTALENA